MGAKQSSNKNLPDINISRLFDDEYVSSVFDELRQLGCDEKV